jgi:catechol 1,2-dioxygenase
MKSSRRAFMAGGVGVVLLRPAWSQDKSKCDATQEDIEGPFWRADAPFRNKLREGDAGDALFVTGKVEGAPDCVPLKDAVVDIWQADHSGRYDNEAAAHDAKEFHWRGRMRTTAEGLYAFETVVPGRYKIGRDKWRPAHIHYKIHCEGYAPLTTQLYFKGDPHLAADPWAKASNTKELVKQEDAAEIKKRGLAKPFYACTFDIVLRKADKSGYGDR